MATKLPPLPDHLRPGLDVVFVGANPGVVSARRGHYYAGPGNLFWPLLAEAGFVPAPFGYEDDRMVVEHGIGLTDLVKRPTSGVADLSRQEMQAGGIRLRKKLQDVNPRVVCFNGKRVYEAFAGHKCEFGLQPERVEGAVAYVLPSTSARVAGYSRGDRLRFFRRLKRIVDKERARG